MTLTLEELRVQDFLKDWKYMQQRVADLRKSISEISISITSQLDLVPSRAKGTTTNKVENYCIRKAKKQLELDGLLGTMKRYEKAIKKANLTKHEQGTIVCLMEGENIIDFARKEKIYVSYAYKIKDNAIRKVTKSLEKSSF